MFSMDYSIIMILSMLVFRFGSGLILVNNVGGAVLSDMGLVLRHSSVEVLVNNWVKYVLIVADTQPTWGCFVNVRIIFEYLRAPKACAMVSKRRPRVNFGTLSRT